MILCANPGAQNNSHAEAIAAAIHRVVQSGYYVLGPEVAAFESAFAAYIGTAHAVGLNSGTDALALALKGLGIGPGDEVIAPSHTAVATVAAIELAGAVPVLVDVEPGLYTLDPAAVEAAIGPRTRAVIAVHLYGQACDLEQLLAIVDRHGLKLIEDCAQCTGARFGDKRLGSFGDVGCFSFYPTKNLGAIGDGGMLVTKDGALAARVRQLREYGWASDRVSHIAGANSRLDEMQAAILSAKLPHLDRDNARRQAIAARYDAILAKLGLTAPARRAGAEHVFHLYVVEMPDRDAAIKALAAEGVQAGIHYRQAAHQQPAYRDRIATPGGMPVTETMVGRILSLPMYPELPDEALVAVERALSAFAGCNPS